MTATSRFENTADLLIAILKYRNSSNLKQSSIGREIGLSQKQYSRIEAGDVTLKFKMFLLIAQALKLNPCDLLEESGLLKEFSPCKKAIKIIQLQEEIVELKKRNMLLEQIFTNNQDKYAFE